jgi:hypothetical protein
MHSHINSGTPYMPNIMRTLTKGFFFCTVMQQGSPAYVDVWRSRVGGYTMRPQAMDRRPEYSDEGLVSFDGADDNLVSDLLRKNSTATLFIAFRPSWVKIEGKSTCPSGAAAAVGREDGHECVSGWPVSDNDISTTPRKGLGIHVGLDGTVQAAIGARSGLVGDTQLRESTFYVVTVTTRSNSAKMWINSKLSLDVGTGLTISALAGTKNLTLGARGTHGSGASSTSSVQDHFSGDVAEVVLFDRELNEGERLRVERSLIARWGQNWADPPVIGGNFAILTNPADGLIYETSTTPLTVEIARRDAWDGYVVMQYRVVAGSAVEGVNYAIAGGMSSVGQFKWDHGDSASRLITITPLPDHVGMYDLKDLRVELSLNFSEYISYIRTPSKQLYIKNTEPGVSRVFSANGPAAGGTVITVEGNNFKRDDLTVEKKIDEFTTVLERVVVGYRISVGDTSCDKTQWVSETSLTCVVALGVGAASDIVVTVEGNYSIVPRAFSFDAPKVSSIQPTGVTYSTFGGPMVTVYGSGFGSQDVGQQVVVDKDTPCRTSTYVSDTEMTCSVPPGVGQGLSIGVAHAFNDPIRRQVGELPSSIIYQTPAIESIQPPSALGQTGTLPVVTVQGSSFGLQDYSMTVKIGGKPCTSTTWQSDTSALCKVPPGTGTQPFAAIVRSVNAIVSSSAAPFVYLDPPIVNGSADVSYRGAPSITVIGSRFGTTATSVQVRIGPTQSTSVQWLSDSSILCAVPVGGAGSEHAIVVDVYAQRGTSQRPFAYESPLVTSASVARVPLAGGVSVTFNGTGFGFPSDSLQVSIGLNPCISPTRISSTSIRYVFEIMRITCSQNVAGFFFLLGTAHIEAASFPLFFSTTDAV